jgi:hypothetical protein
MNPERSASEALSSSPASAKADTNYASTLVLLTVGMPGKEAIESSASASVPATHSDAAREANALGRAKEQRRLRQTPCDIFRMTSQALKALTNEACTSPAVSNPEKAWVHSISISTQPCSISPQNSSAARLEEVRRAILSRSLRSTPRRLVGTGLGLS